MGDAPAPPVPDRVGRHAKQTAPEAHSAKPRGDLHAAQDQALLFDAQPNRRDDRARVPSEDHRVVCSYAAAVADVTVECAHLGGSSGVAMAMETGSICI